MAINAQFPSWITESRIAEAQLGQQMGRNILEGLRFQEQKRQYEEMKPFRNAQMELNRANITSQILQNEQQLTAINRQNAANAAMTEAMNFEAGLDREPGAWTNIKNRENYARFLSQYPALSGSPWDQTMRVKFANAEKHANEIAEIRARGEEEVKRVEAQLGGKKGYINISAPGLGQFGGTPDQIKQFSQEFPALGNFLSKAGTPESPFKTTVKKEKFGDTIQLEFKENVPIADQIRINREFDKAFGRSSGAAVPAPGSGVNTPVQPTQYQNYRLEGVEE